MSLLLPSSFYKTYAIRTLEPRRATCVEIGCSAYLNGWSFHVEKLLVIDPKLVQVAINSGKRYRKVQFAEGQTYLEFEPGQECFEGTAGMHSVSERPELFIVGRGDSRTFNARKAYRHTRAEYWVEDFSEHQQKLSEAQQAG